MRTTLRLLFVGALGLTAACQDAAEPNAPSESIQAVAGPAGSLISGQYIVVFRNDVADAPGLARRLTQAHGVEPIHTYQHALRGFAARLPEPAVEALRRNPNVAYIEQDQVVTAIATQTNATWGIDRIDQRDRPLSTTYVYNATGSGVNAYIIDTGILLSHTDFGGRAVTGYDAVTSGGSAADCNGHGTHVAGTVGGTTWGVAKGVKLYAVRVLNCQGSGTTSGVIAGIDWVTANHVKPAVANMSLGGGASTSLDNAVANSVAAGVTYAVAAGNSNRNACNYSPARAASAITVGATTSSDSRASYSNYGSCLDVFAPGSSIKSAWYTGNTVTNTISGTSMASPHVAGAAALYLQGAPGASPAAVTGALTSNASTNKVTSAGSGSPNRLLYTGFIGGGGGNTAPVAGFTHSCSGLTCSFTNTSSDADGNPLGYSWNFGDGSSSTAVNPSRTYAASGNYTVMLTANDGSTTDTHSTVVSVSSGGGGGGGIALSVSTYKVRGTKMADLTWSGATTTNVDVFRDNAKVATTANDGAYTDNLESKGGGSHTYRVCEASTSTCSSDVTATF